MQIKNPYKIYDILPGLLVWLTLILALTISLVKPLWAIFFIILFDCYWLLRVLYLSIYMFSGWKKYRHALTVDWYAKLMASKKPWSDYYHLVFLPVSHEPLEIIDATFASIVRSRYDKKKMIVVLTGEERYGEKKFLNKAKNMNKQYGQYFKMLYINVHPNGLPDEIPGKGSNIHHAGKQIQKIVDAWKLDYDKIIVSSFDIDTRVHPQYFSCLTYTYLHEPDPTKTSYQPVALFTNNVWESNPIVRVVASSTTFWLFTDLVRSERLFTFSSHSMSFRALIDAGYWDKTIVTEDSKIFLQCLVRYQGNYKITPLYIPVYMNTVEVGSFIQSLKNQYRQIRRWAWGVEHFPWMMKHFFHVKNTIPVSKRLYYVWNLLEGMYSWATAPLLIFIVGHVPFMVATQRELTDTIFQNAPFTLSQLMRISMVGLVAIAYMYARMLPPRPNTLLVYNGIIMLLQWLLAPFTLVLFGSLPAAEAQTRLMLGGKWRLSFWVTEKKVLSHLVNQGVNNNKKWKTALESPS